MKIINGLIVALTLFSVSSNACQLSSSAKLFLDPPQYAQKHEIIFRGEIIELAEGNEQVAKLKVLEVLKGNISKETIDIKNAETTCGAPFRKVGDEYVVMANQKNQSLETRGMFFWLNSEDKTPLEMEKLSLLKPKSK